MVASGLALTFEEFCKEIKISSRTLQRLIAAGNGPRVTHLGGRRVILRETAEAWLRQQESSSATLRNFQDLREL